MPLTKRLGVVGRSIRFHVTADAGSASTFFEMKTRPLVVAAHDVEVSPAVRSIAAMLPPERSPQVALVSRTAPSSAQSPQVTAKSPVHVLQCSCASAIVSVPRPAVFVRYAVRLLPANIVLLTAGSTITGA